MGISYILFWILAVGSISNLLGGKPLKQHVAFCRVHTPQLIFLCVFLDLQFAYFLTLLLKSKQCQNATCFLRNNPVALLPRVRNYWVSECPGHPKTLSETQFFYKGFRPDTFWKSRFWKAKATDRFSASIWKAWKSFGNPDFRSGFPKGNQFFFAIPHPAATGGTT